MKNKSLYSLLIAGTLMLCGCDASSQKEKDDSEWTKKRSFIN